MYKRIVVGLDGSAHSLRATEAATDLANKYGAELHLLTVTRPYQVSPKLRQYLKAENLLGEPKYILDEMTNDIVSEAKEIATKGNVKSVTTVVREGKPARSIVGYAHNVKADLIVVGSRGVGEIEAALLGSVSQKVTILSECAVMVVR